MGFESHQQFSKDQLANAIKGVTAQFLSNRGRSKNDESPLTNRVLERLFENLAKDVRAGNPSGATYCTIAQLAGDFASVSTSMNHIPRRLEARLKRPAMTAIDDVSVEFRFTGPREGDTSRNASLRQSERLYLSYEYRVLPDAERDATRKRSEATQAPLEAGQRPRRTARRLSRVVFAILLLIGIASISAVLFVRHRKDTAEARKRDRAEAERLALEAFDDLGGQPGTRYIEDPPGFDRRRAAHYGLAFRKLERASSLDPMNARVANGMIFYQRAVLLHPGSPNVLCNIGDLHAIQGDQDAALHYYQRAEQLAPNETRVYIGRANALLTKFVESPEPVVIVDDSTLERGEVSGLLSEIVRRPLLLAEAEDAARTAIRLSPQMATPYRTLGNILDAADDLPGATEAYSTALRYQPDDPYTRYDYGVTLAHFQQYDAAIGQLAHAIMLNRNYAKPLPVLAVILHKLGKHELAVAALLELRRVVPNNPDVDSKLREATAMRPSIIRDVETEAAAFSNDYGRYLLHELGPSLSEP